MFQRMLAGFVRSLESVPDMQSVVEAQDVFHHGLQYRLTQGALSSSGALEEGGRCSQNHDCQGMEVSRKWLSAGKNPRAPIDPGTELVYNVNIPLHRSFSVPAFGKNE